MSKFKMFYIEPGYSELVYNELVYTEHGYSESAGLPLRSCWFIHVLVTNAHMYFELICHIVYFIPVAFKCSIVPLMWWWSMNACCLILSQINVYSFFGLSTTKLCCIVKPAYIWQESSYITSDPSLIEYILTMSLKRLVLLISVDI